MLSELTVIEIKRKLTLFTALTHTLAILSYQSDTIFAQFAIFDQIYLRVLKKLRTAANNKTKILYTRNIYISHVVLVFKIGTSFLHFRTKETTLK